MTAAQRALWDEGPALDVVDKQSDSWCTPHEITDIAHRLWPEDGIVLDTCSNRWAIALGFVRARVAWTKREDCTAQPTWNVHEALGLRRTTCWLQPPYSREGAPIVADWTQRWDRGETWETLALVRLDSSTVAWSMLAERASALVHLKSRVDHYEAGVRASTTVRGGSNICSAMLLMTRDDPTSRHRALEAAVGDLGWVYR